jgi:hypothetical protein
MMFGLALALTAAAAISSASASQLVTNGGFESSQYSNSTVLFGPNAIATNWTSNGDWIIFCSASGIACDDSRTYGYLSGPVSASPQGGNFVGIDGTPGFDGSISQTITGLTAGKSYTLSFYMATAQECCLTDPTTETVTATLGNETFTTPTVSTSGGGVTPWKLYSTTFTYTGGGDILSFVNAGTGTPPYALLDGVSLTGGGVPEPGAWAMMLAGFAGLGLLARARRKAVTLAA